MSTFLDDIFVPLAKSLISDTPMGKKVVYTRVGVGSYDPATGAPAAGSTPSKTVRAILGSFGGMDLASGLIQASDVRVSIPGALIKPAPEPGDKIAINGVDYNVAVVIPVWSGDDVTLYKLACRR
jgi:hypothetical protein